MILVLLSFAEPVLPVSLEEPHTQSESLLQQQLLQQHPLHIMGNNCDAQPHHSMDNRNLISRNIWHVVLYTTVWATPTLLDTFHFKNSQSKKNHTTCVFLGDYHNPPTQSKLALFGCFFCRFRPDEETCCPIEGGGGVVYFLKLAGNGRFKERLAFVVLPRCSRVTLTQL